MPAPSSAVPLAATRNEAGAEGSLARAVLRRSGWRQAPLPLGPLVGIGALLLAAAAPALAGVRFENCVTAPDGSITCDTVPTGNTMMQDMDARFGLLDQASPGWSEFDPYAGYDDDFGGNQT